MAHTSRSKRAKGPGGDPGQYQRFLETARQLGLDPANEADLGRLDPVVRRMAKLPPQRRGALRESEGEGPERDDGGPKG